MKELKKLALILRALGLPAAYVDEVDSQFVDIRQGKVWMCVWYDGKGYEVHLFYSEKCVYDNCYFDSQIEVIREISDYIH